jgi:hypothetical protein
LFVGYAKISLACQAALIHLMGYPGFTSSITVIAIDFNKFENPKYLLERRTLFCSFSMIFPGYNAGFYSRFKCVDKKRVLFV